MTNLHVDDLSRVTRMRRLVNQPRLGLAVVAIGASAAALIFRASYLHTRAGASSAPHHAAGPLGQAKLATDGSIITNTYQVSNGHAAFAWAIVLAIVAVLALQGLLALTGRRLYVAHHPQCSACNKRVRSDSRLCPHCRSRLITARTTYLYGGAFGASSAPSAVPVAYRSKSLT